MPSITELTKNKEQLLTVDMRVYYSKHTDRQTILDEAFRSYTNLIGELQERFDQEDSDD